MASYKINIPVNVSYTFFVERDEKGLTKEELLESINFAELREGELNDVGWGDLKDSFLEGEVDARDEEGNYL